MFDGADRLSDVQLGGLCEALAGGDGVQLAAGLPAPPRVLAPAGGVASPPSSEGGLRAISSVRARPRRSRNVYSPPAPVRRAPRCPHGRGDHRDFRFFGGDPAMVNRLSRLITEFGEWAGGKATAAA